MWVLKMKIFRKNRCEYYSDLEICGMYRRCNDIEHNIDKLIVVSELTDLFVDDILEILDNYEYDNIDKYVEYYKEIVKNYRFINRLAVVDISKKLHLSYDFIEDIIKDRIGVAKAS